MSAPALRLVSSEQLRELLDSAAPPRVLDVRTPNEFESAHIADSINVPLDVLSEHRADVAELVDDDVVLVCGSGQRAAKADEILRDTRQAGGVVLASGLNDWQGKGFAVDRGAQRWDLDRQVRLVAGSVVLSSVLGSVALPKLKWLAAGIGGGLTYAALSNTCPMANALSKLPYNRGNPVDANEVVSRLAH